MKIVKEFVLRTIAGESVLIPTGNTTKEFNGMINLSATAAFIWENLEKVNSLEELVSRITDEFDVDVETATQDTIGMIGEFVNHGFIVPTKEDLSW